MSARKAASISSVTARPGGNPGFAREVADVAVFMDGGVVVEQGDPRQVLVEPAEERTRSFLSKVL